MQKKLSAAAPCAAGAVPGISCEAPFPEKTYLPAFGYTAGKGGAFMNDVPRTTVVGRGFMCCIYNGFFIFGKYGQHTDRD